MDFHDTVSHLLSRVAIAHKSFLESRLGEIGLHGGQAFILIELWKRDGRRQVDLASQLGLAPPTVNKTLGGLIDTGLVRRARLEDDARSTRIFLTDEGREMRNTVEGQWLEIEEQILTGLTEAERLILQEILIKLKHFYYGTEPE
jgi:MarR family transcriptional regulator, organic hydroperoxide resistance regulator